MKILYHASDMDGWCSAAILYNAFKNISKESLIPIDYNRNKINNEIVDRIIEDDDIVFISDISFNNDTYPLLKKLVDFFGNERIIWNDHHDTSLDICNKHPELNDIQGYRSKESSGALLTYEWLLEHSFMFKDRMNAMCNSIPPAILYVSDWDTFTHEFGKDTLYFKYAIDSDSWYSYPASLQWRMLLTLSNNTNIKHTESLLSKGKAVYEYVENDYRQYRKSNCYESEIDGMPIAVINRSANSLIFGNLYNEYNAVVTFTYDGEHFKYTIYSNANPKNGEQFNCKDFAEKHGGGGHIGAAGFVSDRILFNKTKSIDLNNV